VHKKQNKNHIYLHTPLTLYQNINHTQDWEGHRREFDLGKTSTGVDELAGSCTAAETVWNWKCLWVCCRGRQLISNHRAMLASPPQEGEETHPNRDHGYCNSPFFQRQLK